MKPSKMSVIIGAIMVFALASCDMGRQIYTDKDPVKKVINTAIPGPALILAKPTNNQLTTTTLEVSGSAYDKSEVEGLWMFVKKANAEAVTTNTIDIQKGKLTAFYTNIILEEFGEYQIWLSARNTNNGYSVGARTTFVVNDSPEPGDTESPIIGIVSPTNNQKVGSSFTLNGTAYDAKSGIAAVYVSVGSGSYKTVALNKTSWSTNIRLTAEGESVSYVFAVDNAGNSSQTNSVKVVYVAGTPSVVVDKPAVNLITNVSSISVHGTADVAAPAAIASVMLKVNIGSYAAVTGTTDWSKTVALVSGTNRILARVISDRGITNYSQEKTIVLDDTKPIAAIGSPANNAILSNLTYTISGTASDTYSGIEGVYVASDGGGFNKIGSSENWSFAVTMTKGTHTNYVYAKDNAGNVGTTNKVIIQIVDPNGFFKIYFEKPSTWTKVNMYYWPVASQGDDCGTSVAWPGLVLTQIEGRYYVYTFTGTKTHLIFNNNGANQTADLVRSGTGYYVNGAWSDTDPYGPQPPTVSASPAGGKFKDATKQVSLMANGDSISISKFTIDGSNPRYSGSAYTNGQKITIGQGMTEGSTLTLNLWAASPYGTNSGTYTFTKTTNISVKFTWDNATVYFVITDRFYNGNTANDEPYGRKKNDGMNNIGTFHGGDLKGLTIKIEDGYFDNLGVNAIWITAPYEQVHGWVGGGDSGDFPHYPYHGYYVFDYTCVDANMGTTNELKEFIDTAHQHGIRVIFDIVMNHAGYNAMLDMHDYNFGKWKTTYDANWSPGAGQSWHSYHEVFVDYSSGNTEWGNWWGAGWIRAGLPGYDSPGGDDRTRCLAGLPDFKTESTAVVGVPYFLEHKANSRARTIASYTVRMYLIKWLTDWVKEYGVDGFRCDTAKHVEMEGWVALKNAGKTALQQWKAANPTKKIDDLAFWMTAEVWGHGCNQSDYHTSGAFDSVINFAFQGAVQNGLSSYSGIESTYAGYAGGINQNHTWNALSYISSHDTALFYNGDAERQRKVGSLLLLCPGGVQIYYGDENARPAGPNCSDPYQKTRSDILWPGNTTVLAHWQKVGQFRRNHPAIGAGVHAKIADTPYTFSRIYTVEGWTDKVVVVLGATGSTQVTVSTVWNDGTVVRDFYSGATATVTGGKATFTPSGDTILIEEAN